MVGKLEERAQGEWRVGKKRRRKLEQSDCVYMTERRSRGEREVNQFLRHFGQSILFDM